MHAGLDAGVIEAVAPAVTLLQPHDVEVIDVPHVLALARQCH
jgi:hypothetical protein